MPADGVYAAHVTIDGRARAAAVSVGNNPTFDGVPEKQVEAYVLDFDSDLYGREITVEFVRYLRGNLRFDGMPALMAQMADDVATVRDLLASS